MDAQADCENRPGGCCREAMCTAGMAVRCPFSSPSPCSQHSSLPPCPCLCCLQLSLPAAASLSPRTLPGAHRYITDAVCTALPCQPLLAHGNLSVCRCQGSGHTHPGDTGHRAMVICMDAGAIKKFAARPGNSQCDSIGVSVSSLKSQTPFPQSQVKRKQKAQAQESPP